MNLNARSLAGGMLSEVLESQMIPEPVRGRFRKAAGPPDTSLLEAWTQVFGWTPPQELAEWAGLRSAYRKVAASISDVWMLDGDLNHAGKLPKRVNGKDTFNDAALLTTLFTGLQPFGSDPSGDGVFASTLPHSSGTAPMHVFNHEIAEFDGPDFGSLAAFVAAYFDLDDEPGPDARKLVAAHVKELKKRWKGRAIHEDALALFRRTRWLAECAVANGKLPYAFAEKLSHAPTFADWEKEKSLLPSVPVLASYWMVAHHFLGNDEACAEALALCADTPGLATAALAKTVRAARDGKGFGALSGDKLQRVLEAIAKNAPPAVLAPGARAAKTAAQGEGIARLSPAEEKKRLAAGESAWDLIRAFPRDVTAHQRLLKQLGAKDKKLGKILAQYDEARQAEVYETWPEEWSSDKPPKELSCAVAAAFRAGLSFDADNPRSNRGLTQTLRYFDDDYAAEAWSDAIENLPTADDRLEYLLTDLTTSSHPKAPALLVRAAERFFELRDEAVRRKQEREEEGPTLDNLFGVDSHLLAAVLHVLRGGGGSGAAAAARIAERTLSHRTQMSVLGTALGLAFRVAGEQRLTQHTSFVRDYLNMVHTRLGEDEVKDQAVFNVTEAAAALMELDPKEAKRLLRTIYDEERAHPQATLDLRGSVLAGLLPAAPNDVALLAMTERILGNRTGAMRVYGALRAMERAKAGDAAWVRPHLYADRTSLQELQTGAWVVQKAARKALEALGETACEWDDSDAYANGVPAKKLPEAFLAPHKHWPGSVFERIHEEKLVHPDVVRYGGAVLEDLLRYGADDPERGSVDGLGDAFKALSLQGAAAVPVFVRLLSLPHLAPGNRATLLLCLRVVTSEVEARAWLRAATREEVLAQLRSPEPRFLAWLDLIAATAAARFGPAARGAVLAALEGRLERSRGAEYAAFEDQETTVHLLPRVLAGLGAEGLKELARLRKGAEERYGYNVSSALQQAQKAHATVPTQRHDWKAAKAPLTLSTALVEHHAPKLTFTVTLADRKVTWASRFDDLVFFSVVPNGVQEASETVTFASGDEARAYAAELEESALRLGLRPVKAKAKAKAKPSAKKK